MRKFLLICIGVVLALAIIIGSRSLPANKTDEQTLAEYMTYADMQEQQDSIYGFSIRYPEFFTADSTEGQAGYHRFSYHAHNTNVVLEGFAEPYAPLQRDSFVNADRFEHRGDSIIVAGHMYIGGNPVEGYSYYTKYVHHRKLWLVFRMIYPDAYRSALRRMFHEIDHWQVWSQNHPVFKFGEDQTPGYRNKRDSNKK